MRTTPGSKGPEYTPVNDEAHPSSSDEARHEGLGLDRSRLVHRKGGIRRMKATRPFALILAGLVVLALPAFGGGIELYEIATPDVGLASAGYAARAQDASTLFKNPSGMSRLSQPQLQ